MKMMQQFLRTGDLVERVGGTAHEIDRILSELGRLYVQRLQAMRTGARHDIQAITHKINTLKTKLARL